MSRQDFAMNYEFSPITLVGGIAEQMGGSLQILYLLQPEMFPGGPTGDADVQDVNDILAHFEPAGGASLIKNETATFPLANQQVAANAQIVQMVPVSLIMKIPAQGPGGYESKLSLFQNVQSKLMQHTLLGGTYIVATPAFIWPNCLLDDLVLIDGEDTLQTQVVWQWNFTQPLLTIAQAQQAQNTLMSKISNGSTVQQNADGEVQWSGPDAGNPVSQPLQTAPNGAGLPLSGIPS